MSESLNQPEKYKLHSRTEVKVIIQARIDRQPEHLKGREVERIAAEMEVSKRQIYRLLQKNVNSDL